MDIYHYHPLSGEYLGSSVADESPLEPDIFLIPAHSTSLPPPAVLENQAAVFDDGSWSIVGDWRGNVWHKSTGLSVAHVDLGDLPPDLTAIAKPNDYSIWGLDGWITDLVELRRRKSLELKSFAQIAIESGIDSDVLGLVYHYPTALTDQHNLIGLITESLLPGAGDQYLFWCADLNGVWVRRPHSKVQIQALGNAVSAHVKTQQSHYELKLLDLSAANTEAEIDLVGW